jgi:hypothetical protein
MLVFAQRSIALALGVISIAALLAMSTFPIWWVMGLVVLVWMILIVLGWRILSVWQRVSGDVLFVMLTAVFASTGLFFVVDWPLLRYVIMVCTGLLSLCLFGWSISAQGYTTHIEKAYRRFLMMLSVLNAYALLTTSFALHIFFQEIPFWIFGILQSLMVAAITFHIWRLYYPIRFAASWFWLLLIMLMVFEISWAVQVLPLGYTVLSLIVAWIWYIMQLLFRFHLSEAGVDWKKQRVFLITNAILFIIVLSIVRWI